MAKIASSLRKMRWVLWHPEQKLWNWSLVRLLRRRAGSGVAGTLAMTTLVALDSILLAARVQIRAGRRAPGARGEPGADPAPRPVLYIDCGLHKKGEQIRWMHEWFGDRYELHALGFEASAEHIRDAAAELADVDRLKLMHVALVGPDHDGDEVRLYKSSRGEGKGDSLFVNEREQYDVVPARRLSEVLATEGYSLADIPVILRMNIEGAEHFVIEDLIEAGIAGSIDGYYGMWDDLSTIDPPASARFRRLLRDNGISNVTFNDRDLVTFGDRARSIRPRDLMATLRELTFRLRRHAIRRDIELSIRTGLARVANHAPPSSGGGPPSATAQSSPSGS
jgi:hypothetical protein